MHVRLTLKEAMISLVLAVGLGLFASSAQTQLMRPLRMDKSGINPIPDSATSFDCSKAKLPVEKLICHNPSLAMSDGEMGEQLWFMKRELTADQWSNVVGSQRAWLRLRNKCTDIKCLEATYEDRSRELDKIWNARAKYLMRNVSQVGQCERATIEWIGPRLQEVQGEPPDGTSVRFNDAVSQVSYDRKVAILASRVGDPAHVCLIEIPEGCPPGDDRGRVYRVTNLRTGKKWELPDSSHECGGA